MKKNVLKFFVLSTAIAVSLSFAPFQIPVFAEGGGVHIQIPGVTSTVSNRVIAFQGNTTPGFTTIVVRTQQPSRGHINLHGGSTTQRINLSTTEFKTEHVVHWTPWDTTNRRPLVPGEYTLSMTLQYENFNSDSGVGLGKITVVSEPNPKQLIEKVTPQPAVISPKRDNTAALTTVSYQLNRPADIQVIIEKDGREHFRSPFRFFNQGTQSFTWNGRDNSGNIVADGDYDIILRGGEFPKTTADVYKVGQIRVQGGEFGLSQSQMERIVTGGSFDSKVFSPNGDGIEDTVSGSITVGEPAYVTLWVVNAAGANMHQVINFQELSPGTHSFTWHGREFMGGSATNGQYRLKASIQTSNTTSGDLFIQGAEVRVEGSTQITVPQPVQSVRVTKPSASMQVYPMNQGYTAKQGDVFPVLSYQASNNRYEVLVAEGVPGYISGADVEKVGSQPVSNNDVIHTVVPGESLWLISRNYGVNMDEIIRLNNLNPNKHLLVGQKLIIKQQSAPAAPVQPSPIGEIIHTVAAGDTLWKISQAYNTTVDVLVNHNKLNPNNHLFIGQKIAIPTSQPAAPVNNNVVYVVKAGDSLWRISQSFGVTVDDLTKANNLDVNKPLFIGENIIIPQKSAPTAPQVVMYTVKSGDTLWKIAQSHDTTVDNLASLNHINPSTPILVGQQLRVK